MRRLALLAVVSAAASGCLLVAAATGARTTDVTLRLERVYDNACRCYKLRFSGTIASDAPNQYVAVLQQKCGSKAATAIAGASTRPGGFWEAEVNGPRPESDSSTYRARWNGRLSDPLVFQANMRVWLSELPRGRYRVNVDTSDTRQAMQGRPIELQRLVGGRWIRAQRSRLSGRGGAFTTVVATRGHGVSYRILVPARTAAPCYTATTTRPFVVGQPPASGSANVIDRTLTCATAMRGGVRIAEVRAFAGTQQAPYPQTASLELGTNWTPDATLASVSTGGMQLNPTRCTATRAGVPFSSRGLRGGAASATGVEFECETPARVIVRIRAAFQTPTKLEESRPFGYPQLNALGEVKEAALAVRTPSGRRLAFASLKNGRASIFAAPSCTEDQP